MKTLTIFAWSLLTLIYCIAIVYGGYKVIAIVFVFILSGLGMAVYDFKEDVNQKLDDIAKKLEDFNRHSNKDE